MKKIVSSLLAAALLSGCFVCTCGYTPSPETVTYRVNSADAVSLTYSLDFTSYFSDSAWGMPTAESISKKVDAALANTGLFSDIAYSEGGTNGYHIAFTCRVAKGDERVEGALGVCCGATLFTIPCIIDHICDLSAVVYLKGKPIWSCAHTEDCRCVLGWYALPVGIVLNFWSVWYAVERNLVCATVNDFAVEHKRRFDVDAVAHSDSK